MSTPSTANQEKADLRYPIGRFEWPTTVSRETLYSWLLVLENLPEDLRLAVSDLEQEQLDTAYRPGGWTLRQVVHHIADSHLNSYVRYRLALTEDAPQIKLYNEAAWADLHDAKTAQVDVSLHLVEAVHSRWILLMRSLTEEQWQRTFLHPERGPMRLDASAGLYAWHSQHHVAHIRGLRSRENW